MLRALGIGVYFYSLQGLRGSRFRGVLERKRRWSQPQGFLHATATLYDAFARCGELRKLKPR